MVPTTHRGNGLARARSAAGLTQAALGALIGVQQSHVARWEADLMQPRVRTALRLARAVGTTVEALWPDPDPDLAQNKEGEPGGSRTRPHDPWK